ncbi:hypothetical protein [Mycobacterium sp. UM_WGJ]|uniref:hypothetical protein n=1 Tax=Mycobacterium sp. UM_WGJ TaxID=1370120 RepID=UPI000405DB3E|nr:hypothetical protein [Mycobacterium sp. UM_WGJ]
MSVDNPIEYVLADPADDVDHGLHSQECARLATVPAPPGALVVGDWSDTADHTYTFREFAGEFFPALPGRNWLGARVTGHQYVANDGSEVTCVYLISPVAGVGNGALPSQAVALAAALREASEQAAALQATADELAVKLLAQIAGAGS